MPTTPRGLPLPPDTTPIRDFAQIVRDQSTSIDAALGAGALVPGRRGCKLSRAASLSVLSTSWTVIPWDTETQDTDNYHAAGSSTVTIPAGLGGIYVVACRISVDGGAVLTGRSFLDLTIAGTIYRAVATGEGIVTVSAVAALAAGNTISANVYHSTGSARGITGSLELYLLAG